MGRIESYSSLSTLASCAQKYAYGYVDRLERTDINLPLVNGSAMHEAFRVMYEGGWDPEKYEEARGVLRKAWGDIRPPLGAKKHAHLTVEYAELRLLRYVQERVENPTILERGEVLPSFTEKLHTFKWTLGGETVEIRGAPDLLVKGKDGKLYVVDHKFPTSSWITDYYWLKYSLGFQLRIYSAMVEEILGVEVAGTLINAVCCNDKGADPPEAWKKRSSVPSSVRLISFTRDRIEEAHAWVRGNLMLRDACETSGLWPRNELACDDYGGCEFLPLCLAVADHDRDLLKTTRYQMKEERRDEAEDEG